MNITDFLPKYPLINGDTIANLYDISFNDVIFHKKEFYDHKLTKTDETKNTIEPKNYQLIIQRFLSPNTLYDELLLVHRMGTGKTFTSIRVIEENLSSGMFSKAIVIVKNSSLLRRYYMEVYKFVPKYRERVLSYLE